VTPDIFLACFWLAFESWMLPQDLDTLLYSKPNPAFQTIYDKCLYSVQGQCAAQSPRRAVCQFHSWHI